MPAYCHVGLTANSLAAITLSLYPYMTWREYTEEYPDFPGESVADVLGARDYRTSFFLSGHLAYTNQGGFLAGRGFGALEDWKDFGGREALNSWGGTDDRLVDRAFEWIDAGEGKPFYSVLWTTQSHHPYDPVPGSPEIDFFARPARARRRLGPRPLPQHGSLCRRPARPALRGSALTRSGRRHGRRDHRETTARPSARLTTPGDTASVSTKRASVSLSSSGAPRLFVEGSRSATVGGHVDISPTILDLLGVPAPASWQGRSLFATERPGRAYFYAANDLYLLGVREGRWKFVYDVTRGRDTLYDLQEDPSEQKNVASQNEALCRTYRQRVAAWKTHASRHLAEAQPVMAARRAQGMSGPR